MFICRGKGYKTEKAMYTETEMQLLRDEMDGHNMAAAKALDNLWKDIIIKEYPDYGDWDYPGMAYRHIMAEIQKNLTERMALLKETYTIKMQQAREDEREACADFIQVQASTYRVGTPIGDKLYKVARAIRQMEDK